MSDDRPIGVFDSGVGGLSILREIRRMFPAEDTVYLADTAHCPYGPRPVEEVRALSRAVTRVLLARGAKLIVVACNTASVAALASLRATFFPVPFVGIVPAVKPAAARTQRRRIGVLATAGTLNGDVFDELVIRFAAGVDVIREPAPDLVELVERGAITGPDAEQLCAQHVKPLVAAGADTIVLGCTHFPFLRPVITALAGPTVEIVDTGEPVARQVGRILDGHDLRCQADRRGRLTLLTTGALDHFTALAPVLLGQATDEVSHVDLAGR